MQLRTTYPGFQSEQGWPYPDAEGAAEAALVCQGYVVEQDVDLDALQLTANVHAFDGLTTRERDAIDRRFWQGESMKDLARSLGCSHAEATMVLGTAVDKLRTRLAPEG